MSVQVAHDQESAEEIFRIVHRFWENMPQCLRHGALTPSRANIRQIVFPQLDSEYRVATAADPNAGRGLTIHNLHCSEVARWPGDGAETLASLRACVPDDGEIVLESTPSGAAGPFYDEWQRAEETGYLRHFFPWWYEDVYRVSGPVQIRPLIPEEEGLVNTAGLDDAQIAWRRMNRAQLRGLAAQEFAEDAISCFRASGECVFDLKAIDRAIAAAGDPIEIQTNGSLLIWFPQQRGKNYVVGIDPAGGGIDGDYCCAQVVERKTGMQCAELHGHFPPAELANWLVQLGGQYNDALLVVERNNHGHGVLAHLRSSSYPNIFHDRGQAGWLTSAVTKPAMIETFAGALVAMPEMFRSRRLLTECRTFVRQTDGSSGASGGTHDDCVMAMAIALAARDATAGRHTQKDMVEFRSLPIRR